MTEVERAARRHSWPTDVSIARIYENGFLNGAAWASEQDTWSMDEIAQALKSAGFTKKTLGYSKVLSYLNRTKTSSDSE